MKLIKIEEQFINLLTKFAWWADCKYKINVVWLATLFIISVSYMASLLVSIDSYNRTISYTGSFETWIIIFVFILPIMTVILMLLAFGVFLVTSYPFCTPKQIFWNTKKIPNQNKYTHWIMSCRYSVIFPVTLCAFQGFEGTSIFATIFIIVTITPATYLFCVDPTPPGLKERSLKKRNLET